MRHQDEHIAKMTVHACFAKAACRDALRQTQRCAAELHEWNGEGHAEAAPAFQGPLESVGDLLVSALSKLDHIDKALEGLLRAHNGRKD